VYQKAYVECFCDAAHLAALMEAVSAARHPSITYHAVDAAGNSYTNCPTRGVQAVTWGVFPGREVVQPTVVDPECFLAWKVEAFELWQSQWAAIYDEDSLAREVVEDIHDAYFLVNLVDNDFIHGDVFAVFEDAAARLATAVGGDGAAAAAGGAPATAAASQRRPPSSASSFALAPAAGASSSSSSISAATAAGPQKPLSAGWREDR
jgi:hypothetical protein